MEQQCKRKINTVANKVKHKYLPEGMSGILLEVARFVKKSGISFWPALHFLDAKVLNTFFDLLFMFLRKRPPHSLFAFIWS